MIIDSLHWWSQVIGVDGFRFDLTTALARGSNGINPHGALISAIAADPILRERKIIAEPWDVAGYALGDFPHPWREWNDAYRDALRQFWLADSARGHSNGVSDLASRLAGSHDIFYFRGPSSSINFVTAHDGFTLHDLVTFSQKHNEANGENNRDGNDNNRSWNVGIEGESDDPTVRSIRTRLKKSILATLLLSSGVPMLAMGDEVSRTQSGSNNAYSLNPNLPWDHEDNFNGGWALEWHRSDEQEELLESVSALIRIRASYLSGLIDEFFTGKFDPGTKRKDLAWFHRDGLEMTNHTWQDSSIRYLAFCIDATHNQGLYVILNADNSDHEFTLPNATWGETFRSVFDSSEKISEFNPALKRPSDTTLVTSHSMQVWFVNRATS